MTTRHFRSASGFGLVEVIITGVLLGMVLIGFIRYQVIVGKQQTQSTTSTTMLMISRNIQSTLSIARAWENTVNKTPENDSSLSCLRNPPVPAAGCAGMGGTFALYDASSPARLIFDGTNPTNGFTNNGLPCSGFNSTLGNDACPFQLSLTWAPQCSATPCLSPPVTILGHFVYKPATAARTLAFNSQNYDFQMTIGANSARGFSNIQTFTSSGTFTVPIGVTKIWVEVWGGGGSGGGAWCGTGGGGGGAAGGYSQGIFSVTSGTDYTVTVGAGGAAVQNMNSRGNGGGTSSFVGLGISMSATGGAGGFEGGIGNPAYGGVGSGGQMNLTGSTGAHQNGGSVVGMPGGAGIRGSNWGGQGGSNAPYAGVPCNLSFSSPGGAGMVSVMY